LGLPRSTWYFQVRGETTENLALMRAIDEQYLKTPFYGSRKMAATFGCNRKRIQRLMGIEAIYRSIEITQLDPMWIDTFRNLSLHGQAATGRWEEVFCTRHDRCAKPTRAVSCCSCNERAGTIPAQLEPRATASRLR
jgi:hypothetical protein